VSTANGPFLCDRPRPFTAVPPAGGNGPGIHAGSRNRTPPLATGLGKAAAGGEGISFPSANPASMPGLRLPFDKLRAGRERVVNDSHFHATARNRDGEVQLVLR
jgi:hypothetical protein